MFLFSLKLSDRRGYEPGQEQSRKRDFKPPKLRRQIQFLFFHYSDKTSWNKRQANVQETYLTTSPTQTTEKKTRTCGKHYVLRDELVVHDGELWQLDALHSRHSSISSSPVKLNIVGGVAICMDRNVNLVRVNQDDWNCGWETSSCTFGTDNEDLLETKNPQNGLTERLFYGFFVSQILRKCIVYTLPCIQ